MFRVLSHIPKGKVQLPVAGVDHSHFGRGYGKLVGRWVDEHGGCVCGGDGDAGGVFVAALVGVL